VNSPTTLISNPDAVMLGLRAASGEDAIREIHARLVAQPGVVRDGPRLLSDLIERGRMSSVCIADDVALPHARTSAVDRLVLGVARTDAGVPFDAEHPAIRLIFLVGTPKESVAEYLQMVAAISRLLRNPIARGALLSAPDEADFRALLAHVLLS
jgi:mannitol/fructose-specific phosphotransferase system IIA component (Ntr-type)